VLRGSLHMGTFFIYVSQESYGNSVVYTSQEPPSLGNLLFANKKAADIPQLFFNKMTRLRGASQQFLIALAGRTLILHYIFPAYQTHPLEAAP